MEITYTDQNNNTYFVKRSRLKYVPVSPAESSSGIYSGGKPAEAELSKRNFTKLISLSEKIISDHKNENNPREMMTSVLTVVRDRDKHTVILKPSAERVELEKLIQKLKEE